MNFPAHTVVAADRREWSFGKTGAVSVLDHGKLKQVVKNLPSAAGTDGRAGAGPADVEFVRGTMAILGQTLNSW
ncbi:hypothetical protein [Amycolatopsis sp. NPDC050768]|uniref:hypothetical protein n=1 Tax=Amycolatopsis sp. NPDC050768 TaxID=3154839 RepID=UPI0033FF0301